MASKMATVTVADVLSELKDVAAWVKIRADNTPLIDNLIAALVADINSTKSLSAGEGVKLPTAISATTMSVSGRC